MTVHFLTVLQSMYKREMMQMLAFYCQSPIGVHYVSLYLEKQDLSVIRNNVASSQHWQAVIFMCDRRFLGTGCYCCGGCIGILKTAAASQAIYKHYWRGGRSPAGTSACGVECRRAWRCALCQSLMFMKYARLNLPQAASVLSWLL